MPISNYIHVVLDIVFISGSETKLIYSGHMQSKKANTFLD